MKRFEKLEEIGDVIIEAMHIIGLFIIIAAIIWSASDFFIKEIIRSASASLSDILYLFIYLELLAMTGIFFRTHRLPVVFLLIIAITAITRYLAVDNKTLEGEKILILSGAIVLLSIGGLVLRYSEHAFKGDDSDTSTALKSKEES